MPPGIGIGISPFINIRVGGLTLLQDIVTYIDGLGTELSDAQLLLLNEFVGTVNDGFEIPLLRNAFDTLWIWGGETRESSLRNFVKRSHDCVEIANGGTLTFTQYEGLTGDTNAYLRTFYTPSTDKINISLNDVCLFSYQRTQSTVNHHNLGCNDGSNYLNLTSRSASKMYSALNDADVDLSAANAGLAGFYLSQRTAANAREIFLNNVSQDNDAVASVALPTVEAFALARNNNGSPAQISGVQHSAAGICKSMNDTKRTILMNALETYMDARGKGIIP